MDQYNFTYEIPRNLKQEFARFLQLNGNVNISQLVLKSNLDYSNVGYAYYAGLRKGDNWNKYALDFTFEGIKSIIDQLQPCKTMLYNKLSVFLRPNTSGYLVRNINFIISDDEVEITLPDTLDDDFETLNRDIYDALAKNEPVLVLDRLHTFAVKYLRELCQKHGISVSTQDGKLYPLHNLVGSLAKYYEHNNVFESEFSKKAMKMSISLFDSYNAIRNDKSFAHDNDLLDKREATYVVKILADTLTFIDEIEN